MSAEAEHAAASFLTEQEEQSMQFGRDFYGAQAKVAAAEFGVAIGLDETANEDLIGRVAVGIENADALTRREVAGHLMRLTALLSGVGSEALSDSALLIAVPSTGEVGIAGDSSNLARIVGSLIQGGNTQLFNGNGSVVPNTSKPENDSTPIVNPLSLAQRNWVTAVLGADNVEQIENLPVHLRLKFAASLGESYCNLSIRRLNPQSKKHRAEQLVAFMGGKSYAEIAEMTDSKSSAVAAGLHKMAESITSRVSREELQALVPKPPRQGHSSESREANEDLDTKVGLTPLQERWLVKVFGIDIIEEMQDYNVSQKMELAEGLSRCLRSYIIRRDGPFRTQRRVDQITLLLGDKTYEEIAEAIAQPAENVKADLHKSAQTLNNQLQEMDVRRILQRTQSIDTALSA